MEHRVGEHHRDAPGSAADKLGSANVLRVVGALVAEVLGYPGVPDRWARPDHAASLLPIIPIVFERDGRRFEYFSAVTRAGASYRVLLSRSTRCGSP